MIISHLIPFKVKAMSMFIAGGKSLIFLMGFKYRIVVLRSLPRKQTVSSLHRHIITHY